MNKPVIALTMGDPAGIGPEICLKAIRDTEVLAACRPVIYGDSRVLTMVAKRIGIPLPDKQSINEIQNCDAGTFEPGAIQKQCGQASFEYVKTAAEDAMTGKVSAIATAPIHKEAIHLAGIQHPGHTEILAELTGAKEICMMMASERIIVSLATIHTGIANITTQLTTNRIFTAITLSNAALVNLKRPNTLITVCALNPHAGENGIFGDEEEKIIMPAIKKAGKAGINIEGPLSPDTAFLPQHIAKTGAYVAMYHDQGLIPFKMLAFDDGVNITLGLPIIRTSADHGTAFDIAWQGKASHESMTQAVLWAARMTK